MISHIHTAIQPLINPRYCFWMVLLLLLALGTDLAEALSAAAAVSALSGIGQKPPAPA